jgi:restriction system protein
MVSRKKSGVAGDVIDLVGRAPWWLGVVLAIASYLLLHSASTAPLPSAQANRPPSPVSMVVRGAASAGQFVLPILFAAGSVLSVVRRRRRNQLHDAATSGAAAIEGMSWAEFEVLVGEAFRRRGYQVVETGGSGPDGGVDLVLHKAGVKSFVQCKQWKAYKVGVNIVRELAGVMAVHRAVRGFVVTSGRFTAEAETFARQSKVSLIDGVALAELIALTRRSQPAMAVDERIEPTLEPLTDAAAPACPMCASPMVRRVAKRGATEGTAFWGCPNYPACKGTRAVGSST